MKNRRPLLIFMVLMALIAATSAYLNHSWRDKERQRLESHLAVLATGYRASVNMFTLTTEIYFNEIINRREVLELVRAGLNGGEQHLDLMRGRLYRMLYPSYAGLKERNLRHLHFHLANGVSFLRFHQPDNYGDSLFETRPTVRLANTRLTSIRGFEVGKSASGFRYVHPLFLNGEHLGSVDLSVPFKAIRDELARLEPDHEYTFVLDRSVVQQVLGDQLPLYSESPLHPEFLVEDSGVILPDSLPPPSAEAVAINRLLRSDRTFQARLKRGESFSIPITANGRLYAVSFLRMCDVEDRGVGYLICYGADPFLKLVRENFFVSLVGAWALFISLGLLFYRQEDSRRGLQRERRHLKAVTETIIEGLYVTDEKGVITLANPAACAILGYSLTDIIGREAYRLLYRQAGSGQPPAEWALFQKVLAGGIYTGEEEFRTAHGSIMQVEVSSAPLQNENGLTIGTVTAFRDITERKRQESELRRLATTDVLTGLANRRSFFDRLEQELARFKRYGKTMALLMVDLDDFKLINDTRGHAAGDEVLQQFAAIARASLRKVDLIGRIGGEEFVILLPGTDGDGARSYAERLRQQVAARSFITRAGKVDLTISIGATLATVGDHDGDGLLSRADRALYLAKKKGRNRVELELEAL